MECGRTRCALPFEVFRRKYRRRRQRGSRIRIEANGVAERPEIEWSAATAHSALMNGVERVRRPLTGRLVDRKFSFFDFFLLDQNLVASADNFGFTRGVVIGSVSVADLSKGV
jgi:hypothetical protein